jgi:hypothetical protein
MAARTTRDGNSFTGPRGVFGTLIALLIAMIAVYLGPHRAFPAADAGQFFWIASLLGQATEWAFWSAVGLLLATLGETARIIARGERAGLRTRRVFADGLKGLFAVWIGLLILTCGIGAVTLLDTRLEWLRADPGELSAKTIIPVAFLLGLHQQVGLELASSALDLRREQVPGLVWQWIRRALIALFENGPPRSS